MSAVEALTLLSNSNVSISEQSNQENQITNNNKHILDPPPLHKLNSNAIKPRALLVPILNVLTESKKNEILNLFQVNETNMINYNSNDFEKPYLMRYRYMTIGSASNQNVYLTKCNSVSDKHACIYYDEHSSHYELLNYSENGTQVDNCIYGYGNLTNISDSESDSEANVFKMSSRSIENILISKCKCSKNEKKTNNKKHWEGAAVLNHGSHIRIGCLNFIFVVLNFNYDYVAQESEANNIPLVNVRRFTRVNKSILYSIKKQDLDMWKEKTKKLKKLNISNGINSKSKILNKLNRKSIRNNNEKIEGFIKLMNNKRKKRLLNSLGST